MEQRSTIQTKITSGPYESLGAACKLARTFSDFVIDGLSVAEISKKRGSDLISVLWADAPAEVRHERSERLLQPKDRRLPSRRNKTEVVNHALEWEELS
jgi:hypothetical protein